MSFTMAYSYTMNAKSSLDYSKVCYLNTAHLSALTLSGQYENNSSILHLIYFLIIFKRKPSFSEAIKFCLRFNNDYQKNEYIKQQETNSQKF